jgi:acyl carrier protein
MTLEITTFIEDFEQLFDEVDPGTITKDTVFRDLDEWSSLIALTLIAMADENYEIKLTGDDIRTSVTVIDVYQKISAKL